MGPVTQRQSVWSELASQAASELSTIATQFPAASNALTIQRHGAASKLNIPAQAVARSAAIRVQTACSGSMIQRKAPFIRRAIHCDALRIQLSTTCQPSAASCPETDIAANMSMNNAPNARMGNTTAKAMGNPLKQLSSRDSSEVLYVLGLSFLHPAPSSPIVIEGHGYVPGLGYGNLRLANHRPAWLLCRGTAARKAGDGKVVEAGI